MPKPSTPAIWASGKTFSFQPSSAQQAQGFDYIAGIRPGTGAPITDDHDWPLNKITEGLKWVMDQLPNGGVAELITNALPKRTFTGNDFIRIPDVPGGLIIQWFAFDVTSGWLAATASGTSTPVWQALKTVNLPIVFPNAHIMALSQCVWSAQTLTWGPATPFISGRTSSTLSVSVLTGFNPSNSVTVQALSIGY